MEMDNKEFSPTIHRDAAAGEVCERGKSTRRNNLTREEDRKVVFERSQNIRRRIDDILQQAGKTPEMVFPEYNQPLPATLGEGNSGAGGTFAADAASAPIPGDPVQALRDARTAYAALVRPRQHLYAQELWTLSRRLGISINRFFDDQPFEAPEAALTTPQLSHEDSKHMVQLCLKIPGLHLRRRLRLLAEALNGLPRAPETGERIADKKENDGGRGKNRKGKS